MHARGPGGRSATPKTTAVDSTPPPAVDLPVHVRRIYNVVDPSALARVFVGAYQANVTDADTEDATALHRANKAVRAFIKLMRERSDD
jgi:hypothetical protein